MLLILITLFYKQYILDNQIILIINIKIDLNTNYIYLLKKKIIEKHNIIFDEVVGISCILSISFDYSWNTNL